MPKYGLEVKDILAIINMLEELKTKIQQSARITCDEIKSSLRHIEYALYTSTDIRNNIRNISTKRIRFIS